MRQSSRAQIATLAVGMLFLALGVAFVAVHLSTPSDGARMEPGQLAWTRDGVVITPINAQPGGLRAGDVVVAVEGRSMAAWARDALSPTAPHAVWRQGETITYTVQRGGQQLDVPVTLGAYPLGGIVRAGWGTMLLGVVFELVAAFIFLRRPRDPAPRALFLGASCLLSSMAWSFGLQVSDLTGGIGFWLYAATTWAAYSVFWIALLHFGLLFPRRHPLVARWPWLVPLLYTVPFAVYLAYFVVTWGMSATPLEWMGGWLPAEGVLAAVCTTLLLLIITSTYRANRDAAARQKIRWVAFATLLSAGGGLVLWIIPTDVLGHPIITTNALGLLVLPVPVALAIAILRYQLFDIDVLINRALVYGSLTATLATVYFGVVIGTQSVLQAVTGQTQAHPVVIVATTLLVAALFNPLRQRLQGIINRRFYRRRYDAARTVAAFGRTLRSEVDVTQLTGHVLAVIEETMQPTQVSLWLTPPAHLREQDRWQRAGVASVEEAEAETARVSTPTLSRV